MKLLELVHALPVGGAETVAAALSRELRRRGVEVEIACLDFLGTLGEELRRESVPITVFGRRPGIDASLAGRLAWHVRRGRFDLIHAHQITPYAYAVALEPLHRVPIVLTEHGRHDPDVVSPRRRAFNRVFGRRVRRITAVSRGVRDALVEREGFAADAVRVIPNGIDLGRFAAGGSASEARRRLGLDGAAPVLGFVGRLDRGKNPAALVRVAVTLRARFPDLGLVVVGDGAERLATEALAEALGLGGAARFLGERRDVAEILPAFSIFASASRHEGTPLGLLEAMAAARPVVATAVGGVPDVLRSGSEGLLVAPPAADVDPAFDERFAAACARVLVDPELAARHGRAGRLRVEREFSLGRMLERYLELYEEITGSPR